MVAPEVIEFSATKLATPDELMKYVFGLIADDVDSVGADHRTVAGNLFRAIQEYLVAAPTAYPRISRESSDDWRRVGYGRVDANTLAALPPYGIVQVDTVPAATTTISIDGGGATAVRVYAEDTGGDVQYTAGATVVTAAAALTAAINGDASRGVYAVDLINSTTAPKILLIGIDANGDNEALAQSAAHFTLTGMIGGKAAT